MPVYFALETQELTQIYNDIRSGNAGDQAATAVEGIQHNILTIDTGFIRFIIIHYMSCS